MIPLDVIVDWSLHNTFQSTLPECGQIVSIEQALSGHEERIERIARYFCKYAKEYDPCLNNKGLSPSQSREILRLLYGFEKMYGFTREPVVNKLLLGSITEEDKKQRIKKAHSLRYLPNRQNYGWLIGITGTIGFIAFNNWFSKFLLELIKSLEIEIQNFQADIDRLKAKKQS